VGGGPPDKHANPNDNSGSQSQGSKISIIIITTSVVVVVVLCLGLGMWYKWMRKPFRSQNWSSVPLLITTRAESDTQSTSRPEQIELSGTATDHGNQFPITISTSSGGFARDKHRHFGLYVPPQGKDTIITVLHCDLDFGYNAVLPKEVVAISPKLRLEPDQFEYVKPACLFLRIRENVCIPENSQVHLWSKSNNETQYTKMENCDHHCIIQIGHYQYFTCWIKHHCDVVACMEIPHQTWQFCAEVYTDQSHNVHVFLADSSATVKETMRVHCEMLELKPVCMECLDDGNVVDRSTMLFSLQTGLGNMKISLKTSVHELTTEVCCCQMGPKSVHHITFMRPEGGPCDLDVSANSHSFCEARVNLIPFSRLDAPQEPQSCVETWRQPISHRQNHLPCITKRTTQLRAEGTTPNSKLLKDEIWKFFNVVGVSKKILFQLADQICVDMKDYLRTAGSSGSDMEMATHYEVMQFLSKTKACVEEIVIYFMNMQPQESLWRVDYTPHPQCALKESVLHGFEEIIVQIMVLQQNKDLLTGTQVSGSAKAGESSLESSRDSYLEWKALKHRYLGSGGTVDTECSGSNQLSSLENTLRKDFLGHPQSKSIDISTPPCINTFTRSMGTREGPVLLSLSMDTPPCFDVQCVQQPDTSLQTPVDVVNSLGRVN
jgi:hypothetical protein